MSKLINRTIAVIHFASEFGGRVLSWLVLLLVLITVYDVSMRYLFQIGSVAIQELEWHLFALVFLLGAAWTLKRDEHVRVDLLFRSHRLSDRHRDWIEILGTVVFLLPFCLAVINSSLPFVFNAWHFNEGSPDPGGLPWRFLLKAAIPLGFALLMLQGVARALEAMQRVRGLGGR